MKYYDKKNRRIAVIEEKATPDFWDRHWASGEFKKSILLGEKSGLVKMVTLKYLHKGDRVLDAGCGNGKNIYGLDKWGYDGYGVDFAKETVKKIKENFPELKVSVQDVKNLDFEDNFFEGYWSLGVIEHFKEGFEPIISEAVRVVKNGGFIFITVPWMSPLRKIKAFFGFYKKKEGIENSPNFYEFMLDDKIIVAQLKKFGLKLVGKKPFDAVKGMKDEVGFLKFILQPIYPGHSWLVRGVRYFLSITASWFSGHIILLVFKKT